MPKTRLAVLTPSVFYLERVNQQGHGVKSPRSIAKVVMKNKRYNAVFSPDH